MQCDGNLIRRHSDYSSGNEAEVSLICLVLCAEMSPKQGESYTTNTSLLKATANSDSEMIKYGRNVWDNVEYSIKMKYI